MSVKTWVEVVVHLQWNKSSTEKQVLHDLMCVKCKNIDTLKNVTCDRLDGDHRIQSGKFSSETYCTALWLVNVCVLEYH